MDIYDYFHSPDIAAHCRRLAHSFSPWDMAAIIYLSDAPITNKHDAYRELIATYPDAPMPSRINFAARESLHAYLRELIALEQQGITDCTAPEEGSVFRLSACLSGYLSGERVIQDANGCYSTYERALAAIQDEWDWDGDRLYYVKISKLYIDKNDSEMPTKEVFVNRNHVITALHHGGICEKIDFPDNLFFHLPVPFEKGDLVTDETGIAYVLCNLPHWYDGKRIAHYSRFLSGELGDGSDMLSTTYYFGDSEDKILRRDHGPMLWKLRYFKGELRGQARFLNYLSEYIKSGDDCPDWLIAVYMKFYTEATCEDFSKLFGGFYLKLEDES